MFQRIPKVVIWLLLGLVVAIVPMACGDDGNESPDGAGQIQPDSMTGG